MKTIIISFVISITVLTVFLYLSTFFVGLEFLFGSIGSSASHLILNAIYDGNSKR